MKKVTWIILWVFAGFVASHFWRATLAEEPLETSTAVKSLFQKPPRQFSSAPLWVWNDLLVALIYLGGFPAVAPMTVVIASQVSSLGANWQVLTASAFISMALPLIVFFGLQRYFVRGILAGAVKG